MTESDHGVNENMIEMSEHERGVQQRLSIAMQGRRPYAWAADVHLSRGAIGRLQKGNLPDAVKLVPALRIDRLSLSWLVDGLGAPYSVNQSVSDEDVWRQVSQHLADQPDQWEIYLSASPDGYAVILAQDCTSTTDTGQQYKWRATEVWGGNCGPITARRIANWSSIKPVRQIILKPEDWIRLITGRLGNAELWGARGVMPVGKIAPITSIEDITGLRVLKAAETDPAYASLIRTAKSLNPEDRATVADLARRLAFKPPT